MSIKKELAALPMDAAALRKFGVTVGLVFAAIGAFFWYREAAWAKIPLGVGGALVLFGLVLPKLLKPIYVAWMTLALVLGAIMTRVLLTVFFVLVLTPVGIFFKLVGRDVLHRRFDRSAKTYWQPKTYLIADRTRFEKFF